MNNKLSKAERDRVSNILTKCAQATKHIEDRDQLANEVFNILANDLGDKPGLFKAACQTYNSCKSIYRLEAADDSTRGNSFAILDVQDMVDRLNSRKAAAMQKSASAPAVFSKVKRSVVHKKANAEPAAAEDKQSLIEYTDSPQSVNAFIKSELDSLDATINKAASAVREANTVLDICVNDFAHDAIALSDKDRAKALSKIAANFGKYGKILVASFESEFPKHKVSDSPDYVQYKGTPSLDGSTINKKASALISAIENAERKNAVHAFALIKGSDALKAYSKIYGVRKQADASGIIGTTIKADAAKDIAEMLSIKSEDADKLIKDVYNAEYMNELIGHSYGRAFMNAVMDESIAKYPLDKLVPAFNAAVAKLPANTRMTPATMHQALINSMMINALATGSAPSKADTDTIEALMTAYRNLNSYRGLVDENNINKPKEG